MKTASKKQTNQPKTQSSMKNLKMTREFLELFM